MIELKNLIQIRNLIKNKNRLRDIGELKVAKTFFEEFGQNIKSIEYKSGKDVDLNVFFNNNPAGLKVEVKSSRFKDDYIKDMWWYGLPIKKKDFKYGFDLFAMVNFIPGPNNLKRNDNNDCVILFFTYHELQDLLPNPFMILPTANFYNLKDKKKGNINNIKSFWNNFYKSINMEGDLVFKKHGFIPIEKKYDKKLKFPHWFGKNEICYYIKDYHDSILKFYESQIVKMWEKRTKLNAMILEAQSNRSLKKEFVEDYSLEKDYCKNCTIRCEYIPIKRGKNY